MKWLVALIALSSASAFAGKQYRFKIADVLSMPEAAGRINPAVKLYFGEDPAPAGEDRGDVVVKRKTSSAKSDEQACHYAMLYALMELQQRAKAMGATAVVGIESYDRKVSFSSETEFECRTGPLYTGVALHAQLIK